MYSFTVLHAEAMYGESAASRMFVGLVKAQAGNQDFCEPYTDFGG